MTVKTSGLIVFLPRKFIFQPIYGSKTLKKHPKHIAKLIDSFKEHKKPA